MNKASKRKRQELQMYIEREIVSESSVQAIVIIGSVAKGIARTDSDIDAVVFLSPLNLYAVPCEAKWQPEKNIYHGIMSDVTDAIQLDFKRIDLTKWSDPTFVWPETMCAELSEGWVAFDRNDQVRPLILERTVFSDSIRQERLDIAITSADWLLSSAERTWETLGSAVAHYRLDSAFDFLIGGIFAYNRQWRTLPSRELSDLFQLTWLPQNFEGQLLQGMNALSPDQDGYQKRVAVLRRFHQELIIKCQQDGVYGENALDEAFIRQYEEPGRNWNMDEWNRLHQQGKLEA